MEQLGKNLTELEWRNLAAKERPLDMGGSYSGCWLDGEMAGFAKCYVQKVLPLQSKLKEYEEKLQWMLTKEKQDEFVANYCKQFQMATPEPWCYVGDVLYDNLTKECFVVLNVKDLAEVRRRRISFSKIDPEKLRGLLMM